MASSRRTAVSRLLVDAFLVFGQRLLGRGQFHQWSELGGLLVNVGEQFGQLLGGHLGQFLEALNKFLLFAPLLVRARGQQRCQGHAGGGVLGFPASEQFIQAGVFRNQGYKVFGLIPSLGQHRGGLRVIPSEHLGFQAA